MNKYRLHDRVKGYGLSGEDIVDIVIDVLWWKVVIGVIGGVVIGGLVITAAFLFMH